MTDTEIDRVIEDAEKVNEELHIKDMNGKLITPPPPRVTTSHPTAEGGVKHGVYLEDKF